MHAKFQRAVQSKEERAVVLMERTLAVCPQEERIGLEEVVIFKVIL